MGGPLRRLAMISLHTSPLDQPGTGDAGGMNVYVIELAKRLVQRGIEVDVFTRATSSTLEPAVSPADGVTVRHIHAGPFEGLTKEELPGPAVRVRPRGAARRGRPAGRATTTPSTPTTGSPARSARWPATAGACRWCTACTRWRRSRTTRSPTGDTPEPLGPGDRRGAGGRGRRHADRQHRHRGQAADRPLRRRPGPGRGGPPRCRPRRLPARRVPPRRAPASDCPVDADVLLFAGRIQPLKAPDVLLHAVAEMLARDPGRRGVAGRPRRRRPLRAPGSTSPQALADLAAELGHRRRRPVRAAGLAGRARPLVRRGRPPSPSRPTTSPSAWSPPRRRPPAPPSSPPPSAG